MIDIKLAKTGLKNPKKLLEYRKFTVFTETNKLLFEFMDCYRDINGNRFQIIEVFNANSKILIFKKTVLKKVNFKFEEFIKNFVKTRINTDVKKIENNLYF